MAAAPLYKTITHTEGSGRVNVIFYDTKIYWGIRKELLNDRVLL